MAEAAGFFLYYNQQVINKLKKAGATSPENAKTSEEAGITKIEARSIPRLIFIGKVKEIRSVDGKKRYYIPLMDKDKKVCK